MSIDFNGTWTIDLETSTVWDAATQRQVPDRVGNEVITLRIENGVQDYEVLYGDSPTFRMGYTSRYDDPTWVPYMVREVECDAGYPRRLRWLTHHQSKWRCDTLRTGWLRWH